ncbi:MAG TPA: magnesium/cobalt transporter CorA [Dongiaceae bacterium]|jgi:magnesium transporter|nr:magnesium/cobalt transporter CorA [Dongiaceae bacterium]
MQLSPVVQPSPVVSCASYKNGRRIAELDVDNPEEMELQPGLVIWVGLREPDEAILRKLQGYFNLHDLAIEDAYRAHQRTKLEIYDGALFIVMKTCTFVDERVQFGETSIFAGTGYVVTSRRGASQSYAAVRKRCESLPSELRHGEDFILYALIDFVVDSYFPVIERLEDQVEEVEEHVFSEQSEQLVLERVYNLRHDLLELRHAIAPIFEICGRLMRSDLPVINPDTYHYYRDIQDHAAILLERVDSLRELLKSALESKMLLVSMRQNDAMRRMTAWAAILLVPTIISGIYGMNFQHMPELSWPYGYYGALGAIVTACGGLYWRFKKIGWL